MHTTSKKFFKTTFTDFWEWDIEKDVKYFSPTFMNAMGYAEKELFSKPGAWKNLIFEDDLEQFSMALETCLFASVEDDFETEVRFLHKNGSLVWLICKGKVVSRNDEGNPIRMIGYHIDISKQKEDSRKLKELNRRYLGIMAGTKMGSWEWNVRTSELIYNEMWANIIGFQLEELSPITERTWLEVVHPDDKQKADIALKQYLSGDEEIYECEYRMRHKNGHWIWVLDRGKVISRDEYGNPLWISGSHQDITQRKNTEIKIAHYQKLLQKTKQLAGIGTWEIDLENNLPIWSKVCRSIFEIGGDIPLDLDTAFSFFIGENRTKITEVFHKAKYEGTPYDIELQILTAKFKVKWVRLIGISEFEKGQCMRLYGLVQDIDERKKTEIALQNSLERNRIFVDQCPNAIAMFDTNMCYLAASQQWIKDYGLEGKEIIGQSHYDIFPEITEEWKQKHQVCLAGEVSQCDEACFKRADGREQWISWDVRPWYFSEGKVGGLLMYTSELTEKKKAQLRLEQSEEQFRNTFKYAASGMALVSPEGKWLKVNKRICDFLGYSEKELLALTFQDITYPDDLDIDLEQVKKVLDGEIFSYQLEKRYIHKEGKLVWGLLSVSLVRNTIGNPVHFISQIEDITERKRTQERLEESLQVIKNQNERLMNFAHIVSHNLRSHTGNLDMMLKFFYEEKDEHEKSQLMERIKGISSSLSETIAYLTEIVRIQTSTDKERESLNLRHFLDKTMDTLSANLHQAGAEVLVDVPEDVYILFNPAYLDSVLLNFLSNALKYRHPKRNSVIRIKTKQEDNFTKLSIADNGLGIDLEKYGSKLFGMYKTFHEHEDARGVGLFITKNQIEAMGGKVDVESTPNIGTTFTLSLRYEEAEAVLHD